MATYENGQSCLEKRGIEERSEEIVRSDYNQENPYGPTHPDAMSDGDAQGKGTGHGGHTAWTPDCTNLQAQLIIVTLILKMVADSMTLKEEMTLAVEKKVLLVQCIIRKTNMAQTLLTHLKT